MTRVHLCITQSPPPMVYQGGASDFYALLSYGDKKKAITIFERINAPFKGLILDSGAFTFMNGTASGTHIDWDRYAEEYADFVSQYHAENYIELDLDAIIGLDEVERLRKKLTKIVGYPPIPVWHKSRGWDYWLKMCRDYPYIAIGGIVTKEIKRNEWPFFQTMLGESKKTGVKVHALGCTPSDPSFFKRYQFYSSDSSSWTSTMRFSKYDYWNGHKIVRLNRDGRVDLAKARDFYDYTFTQWLKYQQYADGL